METKIQKWGNSLGIRIPMNIINGLSLKNGSTVDITESSDVIIIRPKKNHDLNELLEKISDENIHSEIDFGNVEGNEIW
jgi:antitoxin MazE